MDLNSSLEFYLKHLKFEKNLSPNTISSYKQDLFHFADYLKKQNIKDVLDINLDIFRKYLRYLDNFKYSNRTILRKYSSYVNFFKFLENNNYIDRQLTQFIIVPKKHHRVYSFLSENEMEKLIFSIKAFDYTSMRNKTIIEVIYSTGIRVSEAENILLKDINLEKKEIKVTGKGKKRRIVYLNKNAVLLLEGYLKIRDEFIFSKKLKGYTDSRYLFLNRFGGKLSSRSIRTMVKKYLKLIGMKKNITPHSIRHSFASHLLQEGAGIREIQELLGHENISTTQIYTHLNIKKLKKDYKNFHPRAS